MDKVASWKKILKIVSVVCIIVYAVFAILGAAIASSLVDADSVLDAMGVAGTVGGAEAGLYVTITGVVIAVVYLIMLLCTVAVLRGVKDPSKMKLGMVLYGILSVLSVANVVLTIASGSGDVAIMVSQCMTVLVIFWGSVVVHRSTK